MHVGVVDCMATVLRCLRCDTTVPQLEPAALAHLALAQSRSSSNLFGVIEGVEEIVGRSLGPRDGHARARPSESATRGREPSGVIKTREYRVVCNVREAAGSLACTVFSLRYADTYIYTPQTTEHECSHFARDAEIG